MVKSIDTNLLNALKEIYYSFEHINIPGKSGGWIRLTDIDLLLSKKILSLMNMESLNYNH